MSDYDPFSASQSGELVFFDLEFTAWEGSLQRNWSEDWEFREVIQIGAVRVRDDAGFSEVDRLLLYVTPTRNPTLSDYITALTGIDQETLDETAFDFAEALEVFLSFCDGARAILSYSGDPEVLAENCSLNSLGALDLTRFGELDSILSIRAGAEFGNTSSFELPSLVGLEPEGHEHDAMDDSLAIARALRVLRERDLL